MLMAWEYDSMRVISWNGNMTVWDYEHCFSPQRVESTLDMSEEPQ